MKIFREIISDNKSKTGKNYIWYNEVLNKCRWGSLQEFDTERLAFEDSTCCKLICRPGLNSNNCQSIVDEINHEFEQADMSRSFAKVC